MVVKSEPGRLFGKFHELVLILVGFILTTVVGGALTYWYQSLAADHVRAEATRLQEVKQATDTFDDISRLLDRRIYRTRQLIEAMADNSDKEVLADRRTSYREALFDWNENLNRNFARVQISFGCSARNTFEGEIHRRFRSINQHLTGPNPDLKSAQSETDELNFWIYGFDTDMLVQIKNQNVGGLRAKVIGKDGKPHDPDLVC